MREKLTIEQFRNIKNQMNKLIEELSDLLEEFQGQLSNERIVNIFNEQQKLQNELLSYNLSDIPAEEWDNVWLIPTNSFQMFENQSIKPDVIDFSNSNANIDFKSFNAGVDAMYNFSDCNVTNLYYLRNGLDEDWFDSKTIEQNPNIFLSDKFSQELKSKIYHETISFEEIFNLPDNLFQEIISKEFICELIIKANKKNTYVNLINNIGFSITRDLYLNYNELIEEISSNVNDDIIGEKGIELIKNNTNIGNNIQEKYNTITNITEIIKMNKVFPASDYNVDYNRLKSSILESLNNNASSINEIDKIISINEYLSDEDKKNIIENYIRKNDLFSLEFFNDKIILDNIQLNKELVLEMFYKEMNDNSFVWNIENTYGVIDYKKYLGEKEIKIILTKILQEGYSLEQFIVMFSGLNINYIDLKNEFIDYIQKDIENGISLSYILSQINKLIPAKLLVNEDMIKQDLEHNMKENYGYRIDELSTMFDISKIILTIDPNIIDDFMQHQVLSFLNPNGGERSYKINHRDLIKYVNHDWMNKIISEKLMNLELDDLQKLKDKFGIDCKQYIDKNITNNLLTQLFEKRDYDTLNKLQELDFVTFKVPFEILKFYKGDKGSLINNYDILESFVTKCGISIDKFIQYALGNSYDWLTDVLEIVNNNQIEKFIKFKDAFTTQNTSVASSIDQFVIMIKNFSKYPELCVDIINQDRELTDEESNKVKFLFNRNETLEGEYKPNSLEDCSNVNKLIKKQYEESTNINDIDELKKFLCKVLFNNEYYQIINKLKMYGGTEELRKMIFNDRGNKELEILIREMMIYTSMLESIVYCEDFEKLKEISINIANNFDLSIKCSMYFSNYDKYMHDLYEKESQVMLTNTSNIVNKDKVLDKELTSKYGVDTYDFSDKKYNLFVHVKSSRETIEELVNGIPQKRHNFISLAAISNRNQLLYYGGGNFIFAYDYLPEDIFIMSSTRNMSSNSSISDNSTEIGYTDREQRGIVETSEAKYGYNSETLCFREGLKPVGIILPGGREPIEEEIEVAKKYGLKFIKTQEMKKTITNPIEIGTNDFSQDDNNEKIEQLNQLKEQLLSTNKKQPRRIAVIADAHGTFEPTLAALEDARKQGITEIYSLGDNIGTGPNPSEVVNLLEEYGVQSIMGNHELYMLDGVEKFASHFSGEAKEEARKNSDWTRKKLTEEQKEKIKMYPSFINLIVGGQKVVLCHYTRDYNTGEQVIDTENVDKVIQGHVHFAGENGNTITARGVGIGGDKPKASYLILQEKEDGGFEIFNKEVPYDVDNLAHSILESDLNSNDANKISDWTHAR